MKRTAAILAVGMLLVGCSSPLTTRETGALAGGAIGADTEPSSVSSSGTRGLAR